MEVTAALPGLWQVSSSWYPQNRGRGICSSRLFQRASALPTATILNIWYSVGYSVLSTPTQHHSPSLSSYCPAQSALRTTHLSAFSTWHIQYPNCRALLTVFLILKGHCLSDAQDVCLQKLRFSGVGLVYRKCSWFHQFLTKERTCLIGFGSIYRDFDIIWQVYHQHICGNSIWSV